MQRGEGKDVLLLHGYLSCKESFYYQITALAENGFRATAPDILGFGASSPLDGAYSVGDYANWLESFMRAEGLKKPHIIAHSFGCRVALKLLSYRPDLADKLIITGGAGLVKPRSPQYIRRVKAYRRVKKLFPRFAEKHFGSPEYRSLSPVMKESYKLIVNEDLRLCARELTNQTLFIYGLDDTVTPAEEEGLIFSKAVSGSKLQIIEGGHFCFSDNPQEFNRIALGFLSEN